MAGVSDSIKDCRAMYAVFVEQWYQLDVEAQNIAAESGTPSNISYQMKKFSSAIAEYKLDLEDAAKWGLSIIRGEHSESSILSQDIKDVEQTIFDPAILRRWMDGKQEELSTLKQLLEPTGACYRASGPDEMTKLSHEYEHVLALHLGRIAMNNGDLFVTLMEGYADSREAETSAEAEEALGSAWFRSRTTLDGLRKRICEFSDIFSFNKAKRNSFFVVTSDGSQKASQIEPGTMFIYEKGAKREFLMPSLDAAPRVTRKQCILGCSTVYLEWDDAKNGRRVEYQSAVGELCRYQIFFRSARNRDNILTVDEKFDSPAGYVSRLQHGEEYEFAVAPVTVVGTGYISQYSQAVSSSSYGAELVETGEFCLMSEVNGKRPAWYRVPMKFISEDEKKKLKFYQIGEPAPNKPVKTVMLIGGTGSGKTTLVNALANHIFGVSREDNFRLDIVNEASGLSQAKSQTGDIVVYTINYSPRLQLDYSIRIIDTPGYGHTDGPGSDKKITAQIKALFEMEGDFAITDLHAIGFVAISSVARLTESQEYIFNSVYSIFGNDVGDIIFPILTFSDRHEPQILSALEDHARSLNANLQLQPYLAVNCGEFSRSDKADAGSKDSSQTSWDVLKNNFNCFLHTLLDQEAVSLKLTKEVLKQRDILEVKLLGFDRHIDHKLNKHVELQELSEMVAKMDEEMSDPNYTGALKFVKKIRVAIVQDGVYSMNCKRCQISCHQTCTISPNSRLLSQWSCKAMTIAPGSLKTDKTLFACSVCRPGCPSNVHESQKSYYHEYTEKDEISAQEIKNRYYELENQQSAKKQTLSKIEEEILEIEKEMDEDIKIATACCNRLSEIALSRANLFTVVEFIDRMIQEKEESKGPGWQEHITQLKRQREIAYAAQCTGPLSVSDLTGNVLGLRSKDVPEKADRKEKPRKLVSMVASKANRAGHRFIKSLTPATTDGQIRERTRSGPSFTGQFTQAFSEVGHPYYEPMGRFHIDQSK